MRKVAIWGFVVVAVVVCCTLALGVGAAVQQVPPIQDKPAQQVEVVGGTVDVGNLPLDSDGNLKVASAPSYRWINVADHLSLPSGVPFIVGTFDVAGWHRADLLTRIVSASGQAVACELHYGANDFFVQRPGEGFFNPFGAVVATEVHGPQLRVQCTGSGDSEITAWLYLSN
jgi:hypothetical protein